MISLLGILGELLIRNLVLLPINLFLDLYHKIEIKLSLLNKQLQLQEKLITNMYVPWGMTSLQLQRLNGNPVHEHHILGWK